MSNNQNNFQSDLNQLQNNFANQAANNLTPNSNPYANQPNPNSISNISSNPNPGLSSSDPLALQQQQLAQMVALQNQMNSQHMQNVAQQQQAQI